LRESAARYRLALIAGRMGSWETDFVARTRTWSPEGMALFGLALPGGVGRVGGDDDEYMAAIHPEDRDKASQIRATANQVDSFAAEYRIVRADGRMLWLAGRGLVVARRPDGRAHRLVSIMADVTERTQADEALRIERERLTVALQTGRMGVFDYDLRTDTLWWSGQMYELFGLDATRFVPTAQAVTALIHPDDVDEFVQRRLETVAVGEPMQHELRIVRPDGSTIWVGYRGKSERDGTGRPVRIHGVIADITPRKLAEQALREADRRKDNFIATLAHELRNPLAPIRNAVHVLRQRTQADAQVAWCRDVIDRQVAQMSRLLEDLLDVSRVTRGQFRLRREPLELAAVIDQALEIAGPVIGGAGHSLRVTPSPQALPLEGDSTRLAQVFSNLLINAAKYTPRGGRIEVAVERAGDDALVSVRDTGVGIAADRLPDIFEMFGPSTSLAERSPDGLGIGLSLAKGLVEMHGGSIVAHSEGPGRGSEFKVRLPLAVAARATEPGDTVRPPSDRPTRRVLVVDDLRDSADSLGALLESAGHSVHVAYNGEQALALAELHRPEVVLLDLGMPGIDGCEVCQRLRAAPWSAGMVIIAQTGWGQERDRQRTRDAGFDHHLVKPIDPDELDALFAIDLAVLRAGNGIGGGDNPPSAAARARG